MLASLLPRGLPKLKIFKIAISALLVFALMPLVANAGVNQIPQIMPLSPASLTPVGERAFEDLSRCLNTKDSLDVFYLIDESRSLRTSDKTDSRADILKFSLIQLNSLAENKKVNYAVGFFGDKYNPWKPWTEVNSNSIEKLAEEFSNEVKGRKNATGTNWRLGLDNALEQLVNQKSVSNGCQILVFLTDGKIDLSDPTGRAENAALNEICGSNLDTGNVEFDTNRSIADEIRQSEIVHLGVLLKDPSAITEAEFNELAEGRMRPILEGVGGITGFTCGRVPIPNNYAAGALLVAEDPLALAFQFLKVGGLVSGGAAGFLTPTNPAEFQIEPGVASFRIISTSETWELIGPNGQNFNNGSSQIEIIQSGGAYQITVPTNDSAIGTWQFKYLSDSYNELFLYSGLTIKLDQGELIAGTPGSISGNVLQTFNNQAPDLSVYGSSQLVVQEILADGTSGIEIITEPNAGGNFQVNNFVPKEGQGRVSVRVTLYLKTKSGQSLAPLSVAQTLDVRLPENFPSLSPPVVDLGLLSGSKGQAIGTVTALGPRVGSGRICFDEKNISVQADVVDRTETWVWQLSGADAQGCLSLEQGAVNTGLRISAGNSVTANSANIIAQVPVTFYSDNEPNRTIEQTLEINLQSIKLIDKTAERAVLIILTLLGIALPLLLLYLMNYLTTKISMGRQLQRGVFDVSLDPEGKIHAIRQGVQSQMTATMDDFKFLPEMKDIRQYNDGLVEIRAKVSKFALLASWYEIKAPSNHFVFTMTPKLNRLTNRFKTGSIAPTEASLDKIWYLLINANDLSSATETASTKAKLVVFMRTKSSDADPYSNRINQIATAAGFSTAFKTFKSNVISQAQDSAKSNNKKSNTILNSSKTATKETFTNSSRDDVNKPPSPGGATPPPPPGTGKNPPPPPPF